MKGIKRILIALDLTDMDDLLLQYTQFWQDRFQELEQIYVMHNIKHDFPEEVESMLDELDKPLLTYIEEDIQEKIQEIFGKATVQPQIIIQQEDSTAHSIANTAKLLAADLIVVGKKINYRGTGIVPSKLLRLSEGSILFLPETAFHRINRILVPVDFSKSAMNALKMAVNVQSRTGAELSCQHVYHIPMRYFPYIPVESVAQSMLKSAKRQYQQFLNKAQLDQKKEVSCRFTPGKDRSIVQNIYSHAFRNNVDFMVVGSKGSTVFVGSVADGLSNLDMHIPLMVVKRPV